MFGNGSGGALPAVRIPDNQRTHVLRALEAGARILIVPMVNSPAEAKKIIEFGKFPPLRRRGFNTRSRGLNYGLEKTLDAFKRANEDTHFFAQIETLQAVENLDEICQVEGLAGVLIGPGDLTMSAGKVGDFTDQQMIAVVVDCIKRARNRGKLAGILVPSGPMLDAALEAGCNLVFAGGDITDLVPAWRALLMRLNTAGGLERRSGF